MSSIQEINAQIDEYEQKLKELKQLRITGYGFMRYFRISSLDHVSILKGLTVKAEYEYNDHCHDEYGHDAMAYLKVTFGDNESLDASASALPTEISKHWSVFSCAAICQLYLF